jgi:hypothetical protein
LFLAWRVEGDRDFDIFELVIRFPYLGARSSLSAEITAAANSSIFPFSVRNRECLRRLSRLLSRGGRGAGYEISSPNLETRLKTK